MAGMALLTAACFLLFRKKGIGLHFLPGRVSRGYVFVVLLLASPDNYTQGIKGPPLFEKLIFPTAGGSIGWNASACAAGRPCGSARGCFRFGTLDRYWARSGRVSAWR